MYTVLVWMHTRNTVHTGGFEKHQSREVTCTRGGGKGILWHHQKTTAITQSPERRHDWVRSCCRVMEQSWVVMVTILRLNNLANTHLIILLYETKLLIFRWKIFQGIHINQLHPIYAPSVAASWCSDVSTSSSDWSPFGPRVTKSARPHNQEMKAELFRPG